MGRTDRGNEGCAFDLSSAGMIRFRFDGFARDASQPGQGHPEVKASIALAWAGARGWMSRFRTFRDRTGRNGAGGSQGFQA